MYSGVELKKLADGYEQEEGFFGFMELPRRAGEPWNEFNLFFFFPLIYLLSPVVLQAGSSCSSLVESKTASMGGRQSRVEQRDGLSHDSGDLVSRVEVKPSQQLVARLEQRQRNQSGSEPLAIVEDQGKQEQEEMDLAARREEVRAIQTNNCAVYVDEDPSSSSQLHKLQELDLPPGHSSVAFVR